MSIIPSAPTQELHEQLIARFRADPAAFTRRCAEANRTLGRRGITFEQTRSMPVALSALVLDAAAVAGLTRIGETLYGLVEQALDWVLASPDRLTRYFADHRRMYPYLQCPEGGEQGLQAGKTPGLETWQGFSRYDAVITPDGRIKIIELNTGCPAGFLHAESFSHVTREAIESLGLDLSFRLEDFGTTRPHVLIDELLAIEEAAGLEPGLVGLVNDENGLLNELDLIAEVFRQRGRTATVVGAEELEYRRGACFPRARQDVPVSLTLNKIRVSTENSPGWNWKAGFEDRYGGFLAAIRRGAVASVNNLAALTIGEDKGLLAVLLLPEFQAGLSGDQREFIAKHVLWTARLQDGPAIWRGETIDLIPYVRTHREQFVIKPANEGRGFRVVLGKFCDQDAWHAACRPEENLPCVVQEYAELATLPVVDPRGRQAAIVEMFLTIGLAMIRGRYRGLLSRVSANPVNNVGLRGIVQAVLLSETG